ncbi:MAG TPA: exodeoxyribonuclease VII small subunit [Anaeromyxobacteraceae bacterium]|nr:exodeoxyribonuclease VII small subunit [Anaeromyxobacteraceae bacterium]
MGRSERSEAKGGDRAAEPGSEPYDRLVGRLEKVVEELEGGTLTLEQSVEKFAEGIRLAREAARKLDEAERKVESLLRTEDGSVEAVPAGGEDPGGGR